jgi:hypothetical protein
MVDTGSYGLRLFASAIPSGTFSFLSPESQSSVPVAECQSFGSGNTWGTVQKADVSMSSEVAQNVPIQVIADPSLSASIPSGTGGCLAGTNITTAAQMGANGILGIGTSPYDCGADCASSAVVGVYYTCSGSTCTSAQVAEVDQVTNPVSLFTGDNNGVIVEMKQVADTGASTGEGTLVFGIDTQSNNALSGAGATLLTTTVGGDMNASFDGVSYSDKAFFDSGSGSYFFNSSALARASNNLYTPTVPTGVTATLTGANSVSATVDLNVSNGTTLLNSGNFAFNNLAAYQFNVVDIGLPYFYGRHMFYGIAGKSSSGGVGPYVAYVSS